jgi:hypothetical protein
MKSDTDAVLEKFKEGDGLFYGVFAEIGMGKLAIGVAGNFSFYQEDFSFDQDGYTNMVAMMDYDVDGYLQLHLFKYKSFLDPFVQGGIGMMAKDYANAADDPDTSNPIAGTVYYELGAGLGVNIGPLGVFVKGLYLVPIKSVEGTFTSYDMNGNATTGTYDLAAYPMQNFKLCAGIKLIL